ncbi:hypothetical protein K9P40_09295 [Lentilactobacillus otakiensis]|uniref:hypothetical protein n=1 Tax=Lentilactobacillus otakiensis TaxID=481720 RepID=UPI001CBDAB2E|nr:hypothetical protein [Lentilactobacillus otakiensis]MBZ3777271.1 hypothetical protein [Lentilactobacillus otakiensis]
MNKANTSVNDSDTRSKQQKILSMLGLMTSKVLGENTYAKSSIYSERITRGLRSFLPSPLQPSVSLAEFKMSKPMQMGYLVAAKDLKHVTIDQFNYMSLWATGDDDSSVVNRAAGTEFSEYLSQSNAPDKFVVGYKTAVIQFVRAIAGTGGVVFRINSALQKLDVNQQRTLVNQWFTHVNSYMNGASPFKAINNETKKPSESDESIAEGVAKEISDGFLTNQPVGDDTQPLLGNYSYNEDDFSEEHDLPKMMTDALGKVSLTKDVNLFVNNTLSGMLNSLASLGLYALVDTNFSQTNNDLVGAPVTDSTDEATVISKTQAEIAKIGDYLALPQSGADLAEKLAVLNLSNAGSARNAKHQNYQLRYSQVLENDRPAVNDRGETVKVSYGVFETTHQILQNVFLTPLMVTYTLTRNQLLQQIADGQYTSSRNVIGPNSEIETEVTDYVAALARFQVDQLIGLVARGKKDYDGMSQAGTFSAFSHLMRVYPEVKSINPAYAEMSKATKHLYYWLYQSSFRSSLPEDEQAQI